jgi:hypothetical protein
MKHRQVNHPDILKVPAVNSKRWTKNELRQQVAKFRDVGAGAPIFLIVPFA